MSEVTAVPIRPIARGSVLRLWLGLLLVVLVAVGLAWFGTSALQVSTTASGLRYQVVREGTGDPIVPADLVALDLKLRLNGPGGELIQDTATSGQPFVTSTQGSFPGFAEGLQLMRQGGTYRLWVPPRLGYGGHVPPGAPFGPNDTLFFEIHVQQIARGMAAMQSMMAPPGGAGAPPEGAAPPQGASPHGRESGASPAPTSNIR